MEGSVPSKRVKTEAGHSSSNVEEFTVTEVTLDDSSQQEEEIEEYEFVTEELQDLTEDGEEEGHINEDHPYNAQELKSDDGTTKYIICDPDDSLGSSKRFWTRGIVKALIKEYTKMAAQFRDPGMKQKKLWSQVALKLNKVGYNVSPDMCNRKWRNLKRTFKAIHSKERRFGKINTRWAHYDDFLAIYDPKRSQKRQRKSIVTSSLKKAESVRPVTIVTAPTNTQVSNRSDSGAHSASVSKPQTTHETPEVLLYDENGYVVNGYLTPDTDSSHLVEEPPPAAEDCAADDVPPQWFQGFLEQYRSDECERLAMIRKMHAEVIELEKRKCVALENLLQNLGNSV